MQSVFIASISVCLFVVLTHSLDLSHAPLAKNLGTKEDAIQYTALGNNSAEEEIFSDASDDLIFLESKRIGSNQRYHQIDLDGDDGDADGDDSTDADEPHSHADGVEAESEAEAEVANYQVTSIDMSDFVALIPAAEVKTIVAKYYRNDREVQQAYAYLQSKDFLDLKDHIIAIPEMNGFLKFLNSSGLDVVGNMYTLTNLTGRPEDPKNVTNLPPNINVQDDDDFVDGHKHSRAMTNAVSSDPKTTLISTTRMPTAISASPSTTTTAESLNGLHGLVDSILDILPQDQILSLFFDKLETSEEFAKLIENIGSPHFAKILQDMENSIALRNLIFTLHNNGIYITRIVDSLKAYFFLGTF